MLSTGSWPHPRDILAQHASMVEALRALDSCFKQCVSDPGSVFFGLVREEFDAMLAQSRDELDKQTVLSLVASGEAVFRRDCDCRARDRRLRRDPVASRLRTLVEQAKNAGTRVNLNDIFVVWETETQKPSLFHQLRRLMLRRHWLAHGRFWADKSGFPPDPARVFDLITAVFSALAAHRADFPRDLHGS